MSKLFLDLTDRQVVVLEKILRVAANQLDQFTLYEDRAESAKQKRAFWQVRNKIKASIRIGNIQEEQGDES